MFVADFFSKSDEKKQKKKTTCVEKTAALQQCLK